MRRVPWITLVVAAIAIFNPIGLGILHNAFVSNEQLSRAIAQPFAFGAIAILALAGLVEWLIRYRYL